MIPPIKLPDSRFIFPVYCFKLNGYLAWNNETERADDAPEYNSRLLYSVLSKKTCM